jgi:hypothetical protein
LLQETSHEQDLKVGANAMLFESVAR